MAGYYTEQTLDIVLHIDRVGWCPPPRVHRVIACFRDGKLNGSACGRFSCHLSAPGRMQPMANDGSKPHAAVPVRS